MDERAPSHKFDRWMRSAQRFEEKWRRENQHNFEYYDGEQWTEEEQEEIEERGQQSTVINTIRPTIDMVCAQEVDRRCDIQVVGREESDSNKADLMTALLKHVFDECNFEYYHSISFKEAMIGGRSWIEARIHTDERGKDLVEVEHIPWEQVYLDPYSRKPDASDARFIIRVKWVDRDVLKTLFPEKAELIDSTFDDDYKGQEWEAQREASDRGQMFYYDAKNQRVKVCECWYMKPERETVSILNETTGNQEEKRIFKNKLHFVIFSDDIILKGSESEDGANKNPLGVDVYPLVPIYCMRDRHGRPKGIVSDLVDIQDQINKLNSKFLWTVAANRVIVEEGAVRDESVLREEMQKPDGLVILNDGGLSKMRVDDKYRDLSYMSAHLEFLLRTEQRISGVNDSMLGLGGTNERSGTMQNTRISQGAAMQTTILENMYFSKQRIALVILRLIGKFYSDYRVVRITQPNGLTDNYEFNVPERDEQGNPTGGILNRIEDSLYYDVVLKKVPPFNAMRDRQLTIFSEVLKSNVIPAPIAGKMMLMLSDMPGKQDLILELENAENVNVEETSFIDSVLGGESHSPDTDSMELVTETDPLEDEGSQTIPEDDGEPDFDESDDSISEDAQSTKEGKDEDAGQPAPEPDNSALKQEIEALQKRLHDTQSAFHKATGERAALKRELDNLKSKQENSDDWFSESDQSRVEKLEADLKKSDDEIARVKAESDDLTRKNAMAQWDMAAAPVIKAHPDFEHVMYDQLVPLLDPQKGNAAVRAEWESLQDKSPAAQYEFAIRILDTLEFQKDPKAYKDKLRQEFSKNHHRSDDLRDDDSVPVGKEGLDFLQSADDSGSSSSSEVRSFVDELFG